MYRSSGPTRKNDPRHNSRQILTPETKLRFLDKKIEIRQRSKGQKGAPRTVGSLGNDEKKVGYRACKRKDIGKGTWKV